MEGRERMTRSTLTARAARLPRNGARAALLACIALACCAAGLSGCVTGPGVPREADPSLLRVGVTTDYPPVVFRQGRKVAGVEAALARKLAAALGRRVAFAELKWEDQLPALIDGRIDIVMSGMTVTRARLTRAAFCDPYLRNGLMAAVRAEDITKYRDRRYVFMLPRRVGIVPNTTGESFVRRYMHGTTVVDVKNPSAGAQSLAAGRVDVFIHDTYAIAWLVSENEGRLAAVLDPLTDEDMAWAVDRGNKALLDAVNGVLAGWKRDGTLAATLDQWIPEWRRIRWPERSVAP